MIDDVTSRGVLPLEDAIVSERGAASLCEAVKGDRERAAKDFESVFMTMLVKELRQSIGGEGLFGNGPGRHVYEGLFDQMMGEALELPRIQPRGHDELLAERGQYTGISNVGPESLRHFRRSYRHAVRRLISTGAYDPDKPNVVLNRADKRYRTWKPRHKPSTNAVIVYVMDVSGSMGADQKELVRTESFWLDAWISNHYSGTRQVYIVHDAAAKEVDRETFFRIRESGGTVISSAYTLARQIILERFPPQDWNLYVFHFTDGENYSRQDTAKCMDMLHDDMLPLVNLFGYGQVESYGTSGDFFEALQTRSCPGTSRVHRLPKAASSCLAMSQRTLPILRPA